MPRVRVPEQETPQLYTHKDLRSRSRAINRQRKQSQKYYGYRGVHPSWVGQTFLKWTAQWEKEGQLHGHLDEGSLASFFALPQVHMTLSELEDVEEPVQIASEICGDKAIMTIQPVVWTKQKMYEEREHYIYPLDRRHHFSKRKYTRYGGLYDLKQRGQAMKQKQRNLEYAIEGGFMIEDVRESWEIMLMLDWAVSRFNFYCPCNAPSRHWPSEHGWDCVAKDEPYEDALGLTNWLMNGTVGESTSFDDDTKADLYDHHHSQRDCLGDEASWISVSDWAQQADFDMLSDLDLDVVSLSSFPVDEDDL